VINNLDAIIRLILSCALGSLVGYERQSRNKSAGLRTHILVSLGSCLIMILSIDLHRSFNGPSGGDAARLAAQVISGIGFLGAGSIMANKKGFTVTGLTTAASLWVVAAIGLATGAGYWVIAATTTLLVYITLTGLSRLEQRIKACNPTSCPYAFLITTINTPGQIGKIGSYFGKNGISIRDIHTISESEDEEKSHLDIFVDVESPIQLSAPQIISGLLNVAGIVAVKNESSYTQPIPE